MKHLKKFYKFIVMVVILSVISPFVLSDTMNTVTYAQTIKLNKTSLSLDVGKTYTLKVSGTKSKITWSSSNNAVVTINTKGMVTAKEEGKALVTALVNNKKYKCTVPVKKPANPLITSNDFEKLKINDKPRVIDAGVMGTMGLDYNGKVLYLGYDDYNEGKCVKWKNIKSIAYYDLTCFGLTNDGHVVFAGYGSKSTQRYWNVNKWNNIVAISAGGALLGLKSNGTVVAAGGNIKDRWYDGECEVTKWKDIVQVAAGYDFSLGLKSDGTVISTKLTHKEYDYGQCDVSSWNNIIAISALGRNAAGLKSDGTVVVTGDNSCGQCDVSSWKNIVAIDVGYNFILGLKADGTVVAAGDNEYGQCDVEAYQNISAISAGYWHSVLVDNDGHAIGIGDNAGDACNVSSWLLKPESH